MPNLKPIRRGQLITPFGVGALVDFRGDESLMTAGLDAWPRADNECPRDWLVQEERLQARLGVTHFRLPADYREAARGIEYPNQHIPFVRFPRWHYCPMRGAMERVSLFGGRPKCPCRAGLDCESIPPKRRPRLIPSRFIAVCPMGHIEDFPFMEWVHRDGGWDDTHKLRLLPGRSSSSLTGIKIECNCGRAESMAAAFNFDASRGGSLHRIGYDCSGARPWVGYEGEAGGCGHYLQVVQRGASNVYFPFTVSSIYLPLWGEDTDRTINSILDRPEVWNQLSGGLDEGRYIQGFRCDVIAGIYHVDAEALRAAAQRKLDGTETIRTSGKRSEQEFRQQEYEALRGGRGGDTTDLMVEVRDAEPYGPGLAAFMERICLVRKLRETRVLVGFSRLLPSEDVESPGLLPISESGELSWLPATVVHGEGIFFEFELETLRVWSERKEVKSRVASLRAGYNRRRVERGLPETEIGAKFVMMHTFAHLMISQLSFDCGYGSASLRERIYCDVEDCIGPMQGVLVYTASGDSEGTLGGLVRKGENDELTAVVERAIRQAQWCSSDPVCIESVGQGSDNANLAACHGCALLPETSCETGNRLLDRGLIVGTAEYPGLGFFSNVVGWGSDMSLGKASERHSDGGSETSRIDTEHAIDE